MHRYSFHGIIPNDNYVYKLKINLTYSVNNKLIPDFYSEVLGYYGLSAKNIKNSALFIINNICSSYSYNKGSFNIVRKVLKTFQYDKEKMSLSYNLVELNLQGKNKFYAFCGPLAKSHTGFYPL